MAEIPTFQEMQETGIVPHPGDPGVRAYLRGKAAGLAQGLHLEVNGRRQPVESGGADIIFPEGAGGLPTLKMAIRYRARLDGVPSPGAPIASLPGRELPRPSGLEGDRGLGRSGGALAREHGARSGTEAAR